MILILSAIILFNHYEKPIEFPSSWEIHICNNDCPKVWIEISHGIEFRNL